MKMETNIFFQDLHYPQLKKTYPQRKLHGLTDLKKFFMRQTEMVQSFLMGEFLLFTCLDMDISLTGY